MMLTPTFDPRGRASPAPGAYASPLASPADSMIFSPAATDAAAYNRRRSLTALPHSDAPLPQPRRFFPAPPAPAPAGPLVSAGTYPALPPVRSSGLAPLTASTSSSAGSVVSSSSSTATTTVGIQTAAGAAYRFPARSSGASALPSASEEDAGFARPTRLNFTAAAAPSPAAPPAVAAVTAVRTEGRKLGEGSPWRPTRGSSDHAAAASATTSAALSSSLSVSTTAPVRVPAPVPVQTPLRAARSIAASTRFYPAPPPRTTAAAAASLTAAAAAAGPRALPPTAVAAVGARVAFSASPMPAPTAVSWGAGVGVGSDDDDDEDMTVGGVREKYHGKGFIPNMDHLLRPVPVPVSPAFSRSSAVGGAAGGAANGVWGEWGGAAAAGSDASMIRSFARSTTPRVGTLGSSPDRQQNSRSGLSPHVSQRTSQHQEQQSGHRSFSRTSEGGAHSHASGLNRSAATMRSHAQVVNHTQQQSSAAVSRAGAHAGSLDSSIASAALNASAAAAAATNALLAYGFSAPAAPPSATGSVAPSPIPRPAATHSRASSGLPQLPSPVAMPPTPAAAGAASVGNNDWRGGEYSFISSATPSHATYTSTAGTYRARGATETTPSRYAASPRSGGVDLLASPDWGVSPAGKTTLATTAATNESYQPSFTSAGHGQRQHVRVGVKGALFSPLLPDTPVMASGASSPLPKPLPAPLPVPAPSPLRAPSPLPVALPKPDPLPETLPGRAYSERSVGKGSSAKPLPPPTRPITAPTAPPVVTAPQSAGPAPEYHPPPLSWAGALRVASVTSTPVPRLTRLHRHTRITTDARALARALASALARAGVRQPAAAAAAAAAGAVRLTDNEAAFIEGLVLGWLKRVALATLGTKVDDQVRPSSATSVTTTAGSGTGQYLSLLSPARAVFAASHTGTTGTAGASAGGNSAGAGSRRGSRVNLSAALAAAAATAGASTTDASANGAAGGTRVVDVVLPAGVPCFASIGVVATAGHSTEAGAGAETGLSLVLTVVADVSSLTPSHAGGTESALDTTIAGALLRNPSSTAAAAAAAANAAPARGARPTWAGAAVTDPLWVAAKLLNEARKRWPLEAAGVLAGTPLAPGARALLAATSAGAGGEAARGAAGWEVPVAVGVIELAPIGWRNGN